MYNVDKNINNHSFFYVFLSKMKGQGKNPLKVNVKEVILTFIGVFITLLLLISLTKFTKSDWHIAPFGASCLLAFGAHNSPFAQPRNIIGGHLISSFIGLIMFQTFGHNSLIVVFTVSFIVVLMMLTKTTHPPAAGDPFILLLGHYNWSFLFTPILLGTILIVIMALIFNNLQSNRVYPIYWK